MEDAHKTWVVYKQTVDSETKHNKKKMKMASARKPEAFVWTDNEVELLLWSYSTTMPVSCKKDSISSAARVCSPPFLLLMLWDVAGFRGWRLEVEGWEIGIIESMRRPQDDAKHVRFRRKAFPCGWPLSVVTEVNIKVCGSRRTAELVQTSPAGARATRPSLNHADLE